MKLSIITINWNNAEGLRETMESVMGQSCQEFEYLVIDGGSTDGSVEVIKHFDGQPNLRWVSEKDKGIYNAMNKGIRMATGEYLHFLNSGDTLVDKDVVKKMLAEVEKNGQPEIMIGNLRMKHGDSIVLRTNRVKQITLWRLYSGSLNHPASYIKKMLFEQYGLYDEGLKIVSDWKWFLQVIVFKDVDPVFVDIDVAIFDTTGISSTNSALRQDERYKVLSELVPDKILSDYQYFEKDIRMMQRIRRHKWALKIVRLIERVLFKMEKRKNK